MSEKSYVQTLIIGFSSVALATLAGVVRNVAIGFMKVSPRSATARAYSGMLNIQLSLLSLNKFLPNFT